MTKPQRGRKKNFNTPSEAPPKSSVESNFLEEPDLAPRLVFIAD